MSRERKRKLKKWVKRTQSGNPSCSVASIRQNNSTFVAFTNLAMPPGFGVLIKGKPVLPVQEGVLQYKNMRGNQISEHDPEEDMRLDVKTEDLSKIKTARLERSGEISFIKRAT
jgi:uncharacterized membrane protein YcaP (DUF421 family)